MYYTDDLEDAVGTARDMERRGLNPYTGANYIHEDLLPNWRRIIDPRSIRSKRTARGRIIRFGCRKGHWHPIRERCDEGTRGISILRPRARNPELLIVGNPDKESKMARRRRRKRRARRRNYPVYVRLGGKRMKWGRARRKLIGKLLRSRKARGLKQANRKVERLLRKLPAYHGAAHRITVHGRVRRSGKNRRGRKRVSAKRRRAALKGWQKRRRKGRR